MPTPEVQKLQRISRQVYWAMVIAYLVDHIGGILQVNAKKLTAVYKEAFIFSPLAMFLWHTGWSSEEKIPGL